jgi:hypothetical protein
LNLLPHRLWLASASQAIAQMQLSDGGPANCPLPEGMAILPINGSPSYRS